MRKRKGRAAKGSKTKKLSTPKPKPTPVETNQNVSIPASVPSYANLTGTEDVGGDDDPVPLHELREKVWNVIDSYFAENRGLQSQAIASFNRFVKETLPHIVVKCGRVSVDDRNDAMNKVVHSVEFTCVYLERKVIQHSADGRVFPLYPHEARTRNLTYSSQLSVDIRHTIKKADCAGYETLIKETVHSKVPVADVPIMVKSELCRLHGLTDRELASYLEDPNDPGGYFIINGKEKVIVTQEQPAKNKLFLFKPMCDSKYQYECEVRSTVDSNTDKVSALWIHIPGNPKSYYTFKDSYKLNRFAGGVGGNAKRTNIHSEAVKKSVIKKYFSARPGFVVTIATVRNTVPLLILFKALGFEDDQDVWATFLVDAIDDDFNEALRSTMENPEAKTVKNEEEALYYIGSKSIKEAGSREEVIAHGESVICDEVLPALGSEKMCDRIKGFHLGYMLDRPFLRRLDGGYNYDVEKNIIRQKLVSRGVIYAMTSGNWGDRRRGSPCRVGVSQLLNRLNGTATVSYLRRINSPVNRLVRMTAPRQLHTTAFGYLCPADTPEGETVGLLKALSVMAEVSTDYQKGPIVDCLEAIGYDSIEDFPEKLKTVNIIVVTGYFSLLQYRETKILIDSEIMGTCRLDRVPDVLDGLKRYRREFDVLKEVERRDKRYEDPLYVGTYRGFSHEVSITYDSECKEIRIRTDSGRGFRPLFVVKNNELVLRRKHLRRLLDEGDPYGWKHLIQDGVIELLDAAESEAAMIAMFPENLNGDRKDFLTKTTYRITYSHCEIHPSMILGVCASLIPYPDHNQSPRNTYQSGMAKQAVGVYLTNFQCRCDAESHILHYPQRPLVTTKTAKLINSDDSPNGINTITAICCYTGYNQEDSVILNKSAVERGFFRSSFYRVKTEEEKIYRGRGDMDETFERTRQGQVGVFRHYCYDDVDEDGLPSAGILINDGDPLIGKTQCINLETKNQMLGSGGSRRHIPTKTDVSLLHRSSLASLPSFIDSVILTNNADGYRMVKVKIRCPRIPQIGDKFASRHGQKGVMGMDFSETELPFTKDGIVPDLILNPHAIPSRMTIGHLLETVESKRAALKGIVSDGTCFTPRMSPEEIGGQLEKLGYHKHGIEVLYDGPTGRKMMRQVFIGPVFYQRLKHMTEDKLHIRCRGPITELCKQPCAGLQREGGLRFGEMERDSTISHGASAFLRERLFVVSDYHTIPVCKDCGQFLTRKSTRNQDSVSHLKCRFCNRTSPGAATIEIPYACKLFFQELMSMNIRVMIEPESDIKDFVVLNKEDVENCASLCLYIGDNPVLKIMDKMNGSAAAGYG
ncbi:DNA-directed RNA polymerase II subunit RPB2 [Orchesella cincta]|uniref:DNA-directed RNA polymerase subunit beta n=1 Tax=Orchesella cincta TaxID=48709 RepID=A0A1D2NE60_ORCCI|nr:DNA-directed RNA polymerase II subunit RPB2 [Orchesella cincta]